MGDYCTTWPPTQKPCDMQKWLRVRLCKHRANPFAINICISFLQFSLSILKDPASDLLHQKAWEDNMFSLLQVPIDTKIYIYIYWYHTLMFSYHGIIVFFINDAWNLQGTFQAATLSAWDEDDEAGVSQHLTLHQFWQGHTGRSSPKNMEVNKEMEGSIV